jgi:hypothetical protein
VQEQDNDHRAGTVGVEAAKKRPSGDCLSNVGDCSVRMIGGWDVIERKKDSSDDL